MGNYDNIQVPVTGTPISKSQYGNRVRAAIVDLDTRVSIIEANLSLPASVSGMGNGTNSVTATAGTWQTLTGAGITVQFTNPSPDFDLVCDVYYGAWMAASTGDVRMGVALTGGLTATPAPGVNQPVGWGLIAMTQQTTADQHMGYFQVTIPAGAATVNFIAQGYRSAASTAAINYPTIYVVPRKYE